MHATKEARDGRRAERWVTRTGGLVYVPPEALDLLTRRLVARRRAGVMCAPFVVLAIGAFVSLGFYLPTTGTDQVGWSRTFTVRALSAYTLLAVGRVLLDELTRRAERRIGETLPHRVSRGTVVPVQTMLGRARTTYIVTAVTLEATLSVAMLSVGAGWVAGTYLAAFVVSCGFVALGVRQAATRATVAVDPVSLAIDERLRSEDASSAADPLYALLFAFPMSVISPFGPQWLYVMWVVTFLVVSGLRIWSMTNRPWRPVPVGTWWPPAPSDRVDHR